MIKRFCSTLLIFSLIAPISAHAVGWRMLFDALMNMYGVNLDMKNQNAESLDAINALNDSLKGTHQYGSRYLDNDSYNWGANSWQEILSMSRSGIGRGQLADATARLAREFPIDGSLNSPNQIENDYYDLQARTALASRSTSEVAYKQAVREEKTMHDLNGLIDKTPDAKSAADLNNRLVAENAMTNVQQTKLLAVLVQQAALSEQEKANRAREDKEFFLTIEVCDETCGMDAFFNDDSWVCKLF